jgi:cofilin
MRFAIETTKTGSKTTAKFVYMDTADRDDSKTNEDHWNEMVATLADDVGCFIVFDMRFEHSGRDMYRPLLVSWCPDSLGVKDRMMIGSNKDQVKRDLTGIQKSLHAADKDELTYEAAKTATV